MKNNIEKLDERYEGLTIDQFDIEIEKIHKLAEQDKTYRFLIRGADKISRIDSVDSSHLCY